MSFLDDFERQLHAAAEREARRASAAPWWRRRWALAALAVAALGVATPAVGEVAGLWDPGIEPAPARTTSVSGSPLPTCPARPEADEARPADGGLDPELVAQLSVLRRPQTPKDRLLAPDATHVAGETLLADTVRYLGSVAGLRYFAGAVVAPSSSDECGTPDGGSHTDLCLFQASGGAGCGAPAAGFRVRGMRASSGAGHESVVAGLVPDGVQRVTVRYGSSDRSFDVHDNFYGYRVSVGAELVPDAVVWTLSDGTQRTVPN